MNYEAEIKQREFRLTQLEGGLKLSQKDLSGVRTKYNLAKKKLFSQLKFFSSLTIDEIEANDDKPVDEKKDNQMDIQLNKIRDMYTKYIMLAESFRAKEEGFNKLTEEYEKGEQELSDLSEKMEEDEIPVNTLAKKKRERKA